MAFSFESNLLEITLYFVDLSLSLFLCQEPSSTFLLLLPLWQGILPQMMKIPTMACRIICFYNYEESNIKYLPITKMMGNLTKLPTGSISTEWLKYKKERIKLINISLPTKVPSLSSEVFILHKM